MFAIVPLRIRIGVQLQRIYKWEFWPWYIFHLPTAFHWFWLSLKSGSGVFFSAANPNMPFGGLVADGKWHTLKQLPQHQIPNTIFIKAREDSDLENLASESSLAYPVIIKPDIGERGKGVQLIRNPEELKAFKIDGTSDYLLQEFEDLPLEFGVFYSRHPDEEVGVISSICSKEFPELEGDGKSTILELILKKERTRLNYNKVIPRFAERLNHVPSDGEKLRSVELGNHVLGSTFRDANHLIDPQLTTVFDQLAKQIDGFHFGRFDLRAESIETLREGRFKVIEVNGANAEPIHIYDPEMPLLRAYSSVRWHWNRLYRISRANHVNGAKFESFGKTVWQVRQHLRSVPKHTS